MTSHFVARGKGVTLAPIAEDRAAREALRKARSILGQRALVRREPAAAEPCVVLRAEQLDSGRRYEREYGRGQTWAIALQRAGTEYQAMRAAAARRSGGDR